MLLEHLPGGKWEMCRQVSISACCTLDSENDNHYGVLLVYRTVYHEYQNKVDSFGIYLVFKNQVGHLEFGH